MPVATLTSSMVAAISGLLTGSLISPTRMATTSELPANMVATSEFLVKEAATSESLAEKSATPESSPTGLLNIMDMPLPPEFSTLILSPPSPESPLSQLVPSSPPSSLLVLSRPPSSPLVLSCLPEPIPPGPALTELPPKPAPPEHPLLQSLLLLSTRFSRTCSS
ncbi:hypothetical protein QQF64_016109 [Cirrhinus molitorella]|uniref:Secreted protein n=1 Tax=Cirrhinus molitorella TaxID=172907 RepID=A0ABR3LLV5_9TELE